MAQWTLEQATAIIKKALSRKGASDSAYQEAMELTFPDRDGFSQTAEGQTKASRNWDSAATISIIKAANRMSSEFTPQFSTWLEIGLGAAALAMPDDTFKDTVGISKEEAKERLEAVSKVVQAVFNGPGFPTASNELYIDWHYGQGGMKIMPNDDIIGEPVIFSSMPLANFYAEEGPNGRLDRWFFWHKKRADIITAEWKDAKLNAELEEKARMPSPSMIDLVSVVYRDYDSKPARGKIAAEPPFRYEVFYLSGDKANRHRLVERRTKKSPFVTPRNMKLAGENRGRGPVLFAMPDIRTANKVTELTMRAVSIAVLGVWTATDGVATPISLKPLSIINVRRNGGPDGPSLQRLDNPQRIDYGELVLEKLQENIRKLIGDGGLPPEAGAIRSPTEFIQRARELIADKAGGLGRLKSEFIVPAVQRVISILEDKGLLPEMGLEIDQFIIEVRITSPLARGEAMQAVENLVQFMEILTGLGDKELLAYEMNMRKATPYLADLMEIPREIRTSEVQKKASEKAMAETAAAAAGADPEVASEAFDQAEIEQEVESG